MKRAQATAAVDQMLQRFFDDRADRPLNLITEIAVFGSYARGAAEPHDVDVHVTFDQDEDWISDTVAAMFSGRDPHTPIRKALRGAKRSLQIICEPLPDEITAGAVVLWRTGDTHADALARLHAIPADDNATRAPRDAMIDAFDGLDRILPMAFRKPVADAVAAGAIAVTQLTLPDQQVTDPDARKHITRRWQPTSPLYRAAHAILAYYEQHNIAPAQVHLHGRDVRPGPTPYYAGMGLRYANAIGHCLGNRQGVQWLEVVHPTSTKPLVALLIEPADREVLAGFRWH
ncbi:nucleotidyltransferase domain-containing protein [Catellatospora citrea]|uniref:nucleotidyltransferase domain-containing protein n=1 Tax=Catellatospora citrea TaxID=53366 RepID=UPI0033E0C274